MSRMNPDRERPVDCERYCGERLPESYMVEDSRGRLICPTCIKRSMREGRRTGSPSF